MHLLHLNLLGVARHKFSPVSFFLFFSFLLPFLFLPCFFFFFFFSFLPPSPFFFYPLFFPLFPLFPFSPLPLFFFFFSFFFFFFSSLFIPAFLIDHLPLGSQLYPLKEQKKALPDL